MLGSKALGRIPHIGPMGGNYKDELEQVLVRPGVAVPLRLHRGSSHEAVVLRAVPAFGAGRRPAFDFVAVK